MMWTTKAKRNPNAPVQQTVQEQLEAVLEQLKKQPVEANKAKPTKK